MKKEDVYQLPEWRPLSSVYRTLVEHLLAASQVTLIRAVKGADDPVELLRQCAVEALATGCDQVAKTHLQYLVRACEDAVFQPVRLENGNLRFEGTAPNREGWLKVSERAAALMSDLVAALPPYRELPAQLQKEEESRYLMSETREFLFTVIALRWSETEDEAEARRLFKALMGGLSYKDLSLRHEATKINEALRDVVKAVSVSCRIPLGNLAMAYQLLNELDAGADSWHPAPPGLPEFRRILRMAYASHTDDGVHRHDLHILNSLRGASPEAITYAVARGQRALAWEQKVQELFKELGHPYGHERPKGDPPTFDEKNEEIEVAYELGWANDEKYEKVLEVIKKWRASWPRGPSINLIMTAKPNHRGGKAWTRQQTVR